MTTQLITSTTYLWRSLRGVRDEQDSSFKSLLELNVLDCWRLDSAGIPVAGGGRGVCNTEAFSAVQNTGTVGLPYARSL